MKRAINFFNLRTVFVLLISQIATFIAIHYKIKFNLDLLLFGLAIGFPLAFSIQSAFKRRDRALEYLSLFKAGTLSLFHCFKIEEDLSHERKKAAFHTISNLINQVTTQLTSRIASYESVQERIEEVMDFIEKNRESLSGRNVMRMVRYLRDVAESSAYLISLVNHRTMAGLRFYSIAFITVFPLVQAPIVLYKLDDIVPYWLIHFLMAFSSLILITLHNFQKMIEYPFAPEGMDNIRVNDFKINF
jgi:hypothetical protein